MAGLHVGAGLVAIAAVLTFLCCKHPAFSRDILTESVAEEYDYIVVGGGTAGAVVAARLSEDPEHTVLLLEAGGFYDEDPDFHVPLYWPNLQRTEYDWEYYSEPQTESGLALNGRKSSWPRGRVLGGTSILNGAQYTRGSPFEYDQWSKNGCTGWSYKEVLPYFLKSENMLIPELKSSKYHNTGGPLRVTQGGVSKLFPYYLKAGKELEYDITDYNGEDQQGFSLAQLTVHNGVRQSTGYAFLGQREKRDNLDIVVRGLVTNIDIEDKRARGVYFIRNGRKHFVKVRKEIVVSAGVINSPQLLMLSGVGPKDHLDQVGISVKADLPVGENLQDHVMALMSTPIKKPYSLSADVTSSLWAKLQYHLLGSGPLAYSGVEGAAFLHLDKTMKGKNPPDIHMAFISALLSRKLFNINDTVADEFLPNDPYEHGFSTFLCLTHPLNKGNIKLKSADPFDYPLIQTNYLTDRRDLDQLIKGIRIWEKIMETQTMQELGIDFNRSKLSICSEHAFRSDAYWECYVRHLGLTVFHHTSSCKMGAADDPTAVVDPQLRVRGIKGLRVADASIFPNVTSGNTMAPVIMVAEKAADMIRGKNTVAHFERDI